MSGVINCYNTSLLNLYIYDYNMHLLYFLQYFYNNLVFPSPLAISSKEISIAIQRRNAASVLGPVAKSSGLEEVFLFV
jgi:hypothetical protein